MIFHISSAHIMSFSSGLRAYVAFSWLSFPGFPVNISEWPLIPKKPGQQLWATKYSGFDDESVCPLLWTESEVSATKLLVFSASSSHGLGVGLGEQGCSGWVRAASGRKAKKSLSLPKALAVFQECFAICRLLIYFQCPQMTVFDHFIQCVCVCWKDSQTSLWRQSPKSLPLWCTFWCSFA